MSLWSSVVFFIKQTGLNLASRLIEIRTLDSRIREAWSKLDSSFELDCAKLAAVLLQDLPNLLLLHVIYNQCLCSLHSSIVPLFSWSRCEGVFAYEQQLSAQTAFEHANSRAVRNVLANLKTLQILGKHWAFSDVLDKFACGLYKVHASSPFPLTDEPKNMHPETLREFKPANSKARLSILTHNFILISEHGSTVQAADDIEDIGLEDADSRGPVSAEESIVGCISQISREVGAATSQLPITINPFIAAETVNGCVVDSSLDGSMLGLGMEQIGHIDDYIMDLLRQGELLQQGA
ncbi:hypothetical protein AtubIFM57258_005823 [Aspergillus tubingensis]|nr:hypothetical protein AtubIFM57258_005823 [Aspergillus tubingensis]